MLYILFHSEFIAVFPLLFLITFSALALGAKSPDIKRDETFAAMKFKPTDSVAWLVLGHIFEAEGDKAKANDCLKEALSLNLAQAARTLQRPVLPLVPSSPISEAQAKGTQMARWLEYNTAPAHKPPLLSLSRIIKLPLQLSAVLVWSQYFEFPLSTALEAFLMVLLLVIAGGLTWRTVKLLQLGFRSRDWLETQALVIGSFIKRYQHEKGRNSYGLYVMVSYKIKEKHYQASLPSADIYGYRQTWLKPAEIARGNSESDIRDIQKNYAFGQVVTVYYDPEKPELVTDQRGFEPHIKTLLLKFGGWALSCWVFAALIWFLGF